MVKLRSTRTITRVDTAQFSDLCAAILDRLRSIEFDDGLAIRPADGARLAGLSNPSGSHPRPGSDYVVTTEHIVLPDSTPEQEAAFKAALESGRRLTRQDFTDHFEERRRRAVEDGTLETVHNTAHLRLLTDDEAVCSFDVTLEDVQPIDLVVHVDTPRRPTSVRVESSATPTTSSRFLAGDVTIVARAELADIGRGRPAITATADHRRGNAKIEITIADAGMTESTVGVNVTARGAGVFRPVAAVAGLIGRRFLQRALDDELDGGGNDESVFDLARFQAFTADLAARSPRQVADELVTDALNQVVEIPPTDR